MVSIATVHILEYGIHTIARVEGVGVGVPLVARNLGQAREDDLVGHVLRGYSDCGKLPLPPRRCASHGLKPGRIRQRDVRFGGRLHVFE